MDFRNAPPIKVYILYRIRIPISLKFSIYTKQHITQHRYKFGDNTNSNKSTYYCNSLQLYDLPRNGPRDFNRLFNFCKCSVFCINLCNVWFGGCFRSAGLTAPRGEVGGAHRSANQMRRYKPRNIFRVRGHTSKSFTKPNKSYIMHKV